MDSKRAALEQVAALLDTQPDWLNSLISFESNSNPQARAGVPYNIDAVNRYGATPLYARGLIQFIDTTAQALGFLNASDLVAKYPDYETQLLGPVYRYLKQFKPFPTKQSLYMAVFYPAARNWTPETVFPDTVRRANPNINTVKDYINFVEKKNSQKKQPQERE